MAEQQLSTRQRQLREQEEAAQAHGGASVLSLADRAQDGETDPQFVVPGAGGQTPGEVEDKPVAQPDLVVRRSQSIVAAEEAGEPIGEPQEKERGTRAQRGDTEPGTTDKAGRSDK